MADQATGGISVRFEQTGAEAVQKSVEALTEAVNSLTSQVANLTGGQKALVQSTEEVSRVQNQVSVSSGLADNALRRQLVSVSRLQGGVAALIPALGSTSYAFRRVAIAAGGLLTINPAFAALAGSVAAFGLALNHLADDAQKAREETEKLVNTQMAELTIQNNLRNNEEQVRLGTDEQLRNGEVGTDKVWEYIDQRQRQIDAIWKGINRRENEQLDWEEQIDDYKRLTEARERYNREVGRLETDPASENFTRVAEQQAKLRAAFSETVTEVSNFSKEYLASLSESDFTDVVNRVGRSLGVYADLAKGRISALDSEISKMEEQSGTLFTEIDEALLLIEDADEWDTYNEGIKRAIENTKKLDEQNRQLELQEQNAARLEAAWTRDYWQHYADTDWNADELQDQIEFLQDQNAQDRAEINKIYAKGSNASVEETDQAIGMYSTIGMREGAIKQLQQRLDEMTKAPEIINPFQNFSSTQTDLEAHGADIGAGIGGSSINEELQQLTKIYNVLNRVEENTRQDAVGVVGQ